MVGFLYNTHAAIVLLFQLLAVGGGTAQMLLQLVELLDECADALQQFLSHDEHLFLVFRLHELAPCRMNHGQDGHEVLLSGDEDSFAEGFVPQSRLGGEGQLQSTLVGHIHDDEVHRLAGRLHVAVVLLGGQPLKLLLDAAYHILGQLLAQRLVFGLDILRIGIY